ncbi:class A rhodopsin-like G-protein coupled receptor GPRop3, putative [Pediculus humanus corporis]|nr:class A rhodopsin-like G-protein coupled receptor GPRop3, putative [Pediculus humanus corporis]EEB19925.1 class A rhodopsin-like G-protein coupled receptor GPRop3, putative [Pediculus humanus corporis]
MVVGVFGNFLIIYLFLRKRSLRTPSNVFIFNLAVSDSLLLLKMPVFIINSFYLGPALGNLGCSAYGFVGGLTGTVSIMTLAAIAFDRYQVIVHPLERKTKAAVYFQILLIWIYAIFFSIIPLLDVGLNKYVPEGYLTSCSFDYLTQDTASRLTIFVFFVAAWIVPLSIILGSYMALYKVVLKARGTHFNTVMTRHCKDIEIQRPELKAAVTVICIVCLWTLSWTPYAVVALLGITGNEKYISPMSSMIPALFCKTASCIDPFVYAATNRRFRNELKRKYRKRSRYQPSLKTERKDFFTLSEDNNDRGKGNTIRIREK